MQKRRGELFKGESSAYVELEHPVGEAQADFGTIHCVRDSKIVEIKSLVLSFPRSNAGFAVPMPSDCQTESYGAVTYFVIFESKQLLILAGFI